MPGYVPAKGRPLFEQNVQYVTGVGEKRAALLQKLGVSTVGELLYLFPRAYEDWTAQQSLYAAPTDTVCTVCATVLAPPTQQRIRGGMTLYKVRATDGEADLLLTFFNNPYLDHLLQQGKEYYFRGKLTGNLLRREMSSPEFLPAEKKLPIVPVYPQTGGLTTRQISSAVKAALAMLPQQLNDPLPDSLRRELKLCTLRFALQNMHFPTGQTELELARYRLIFEELLVLQLGLLHLRSFDRAQKPTITLQHDYSAEFEGLLPYTLTGAQKRCIAQAMHDMLCGSSPMNRLLQGDVGSGKTAVAASLCYSVAKNGWQAAFMAPTEILAAQHYRTLTAMLSDSGVRIALLTGAVTGAARKDLLARLQQGEIDLLIGTHALLGENVVFARLALVITDEQHRFGVKQRTVLAQKGSDPHFLVMSATPIPRTMALMLYGDLDISLLDELPPGRQKIQTFHIDTAKRQRAYGYILQHLQQGRQAYIICPMIEEGQNDMGSVTEYAQSLQQGAFSAYNVGMLHGRMKQAQKDAVMHDFACGKYQVLVSTTVVEVGVDVPNAVIILIENAERYGLSQLHQLRGRVGRGSTASTCILVSDSQNKDTLARLRVLCETGDGFRIANEDLKLRGPGDFFGARQHGLPPLHIADMLRDMHTLELAQRTAQQLHKEDPNLSMPEHRGLKAEIRRLFAKSMPENAGQIFG